MEIQPTSLAHLDSQLLAVFRTKIKHIPYTTFQMQEKKKNKTVTQGYKYIVLSLWLWSQSTWYAGQLIIKHQSNSHFKKIFYTKHS